MVSGEIAGSVVCNIRALPVAVSDELSAKPLQTPARRRYEMIN